MVDQIAAFRRCGQDEANRPRPVLSQIAKAFDEGFFRLIVRVTASILDLVQMNASNFPMFELFPHTAYQVVLCPVWIAGIS